MTSLKKAKLVRSSFELHVFASAIFCGCYFKAATYLGVRERQEMKKRQRKIRNYDSHNFTFA
jgi:hypothetical protein